MVEMHYEEEVGVADQNAPGGERLEIRHWRILVNDEAAAVAQAAQDVAEGRNPVAVMEHPAQDPWDVRVEYDVKKWKTLLPKSRLRGRAAGVGPAFGE